jgi:hypothetical protein
MAAGEKPYRGYLEKSRMLTLLVTFTRNPNHLE